MRETRPAAVVPLHPASAAAAPIEERDDEDLMVLAAREHRRAFEVLAGRYLLPLTSFCAKFLGNVRAGEEVAQDVLVQAWEGRRRYRPGRFRVFLFTIARNRCLNWLRDDRRRRWSGVLEVDSQAASAAPSERPDQLDQIIEEERHRRVRAALVRLAPKLREALLLRFDQGLGYAEIARIVRRPEVTVRSRVFHALKRVRAALAEEVP